MNLRERVRVLEQVLEPQEAYRVIFVADDAEQAVETRAIGKRPATADTWFA